MAQVNSRDKITAATYNTYQSRVATIVGTGFESSGYGQTLNSSSVSANDTVTAANLEALRDDINNARVHQTGSLTPLNEITARNIIGAAESGTGVSITYNSETEEYDTEIEGSMPTKGWNDYDAEITNIENDRFLVDDSQVSVEAGVTSTRTTQWNGTITHDITVTFTSSNARRYFFNAGGAIQFKAQLSNGSGAKDSDWATMLSNMGTISFAYTNTSATGSGTGTAIGNYDLTSSYQKVFEKAGSGVYAENKYIIRARSTANNTIDFNIRFEDNDVGEGDTGPGYIPIDENVLYISGTILSTVQQKRATGSYVSTTSPTYTNTSDL